MWSRWPLTGWPETSTLWTTWMTGSSCVTRMGRHVLPSWIRSCTTPKASLWTPPWGECGHFLKVRREGHHTNFVQRLRCVIHRCYSTLKYVEIEKKNRINWMFGSWSNWAQMLAVCWLYKVLRGKACFCFRLVCLWPNFPAEFLKVRLSLRRVVVILRDRSSEKTARMQECAFACTYLLVVFLPHGFLCCNWFVQEQVELLELAFLLVIGSVIRGRKRQ